ncbi:MAG: NAD(P)H-hydrate dehydratase [Candidatus Pacearchaeota archaeon]
MMVVQIKSLILKKVYKKRGAWSKKGDFGRLLVVGGSEKYSGSVMFNALSAIASLRSGTDVVEVASPRRVSNIIASYSPDIITIPLDGKFINRGHLKILERESKNKTGFVIGGGICREKETLYFVRGFLKVTKLRGVIDADAVYALKEGMNLNNFVLTPHAGEFFVLTGRKVGDNLEQRINVVKEEARRLGTIILLKGNVDVISDGNKVAINKTGTPHMTKGGTGDVLAGVVGGLIAQGNDLFDSACAGAYINGKAGEMTKRKNSLMASDLIEQIGKISDSLN